jgi:TolB protein
MRKSLLSRSLTLTAILCLLGLALLGCAPQATLTPETINTIAPPTETREVIPIVAENNARDMIIFSFEEDGFAHLFAYVPNQVPLTRMTFGNWDDISPSPEPGGKRLAFASNRSGFWDLYLMDLSSGEISQLTDTPEYESAPSWSPDGSFLTYETYVDDNLEIAVGPANNPLEDAVRLTNSPAADHSPVWAPGGRGTIWPRATRRACRRCSSTRAPRRWPFGREP